MRNCREQGVQVGVKRVPMLLREEQPDLLLTPRVKQCGLYPTTSRSCFLPLQVGEPPSPPPPPIAGGPHRCPRRLHNGPRPHLFWAKLSSDATSRKARAKIRGVNSAGTTRGCERRGTTLACTAGQSSNNIVVRSSPLVFC